jgi:hypothetical protein
MPDVGISITRGAPHRQPILRSFASQRCTL